MMGNSRQHRNPNAANNKKGGKKFPATQSCFSGVSGAIFLVTFICINVVVFLMEGPFLYLNIIYTLYTLIIAAFVLQILLDLGIWECTKSGSPRTRNILSRLCPILCIAMSLPPTGLLWHTKNRGGFTSDMSDISLIFSILIVGVEVFHLALTLFVYRSCAKNKHEESSVRFSYYNDDGQSIGPSPASSVRSSRIDFIMNRSRNSLASIDSGFMNSNFANMRSQRESAMDVTARFWSEEQQQAALDHQTLGHHQGQISYVEDGYRNSHSSHAGVSSPSSINNRVEQQRHDFPSRRREKRSGSHSRVGSAGASHSHGSSRRGSRASKDDIDLMDTQSIKSSGSNRSRSRRRRDYEGYRVEEEMMYQPGFFQPFYLT